MNDAVRFHNLVMCPENANGLANSVESDQLSLPYIIIVVDGPIFVAPALAGCNIGILFSIHLQFMSALIFKSICCVVIATDHY